MSWKQYCYKSYGYMVREAKAKEPLRMILSVLYNSNVDKKDSLTPEKLMPLFTDIFNAEAIDPNEKKRRLADQKQRGIETVKKLNEKLAAEHGNRAEG